MSKKQIDVVRIVKLLFGIFMVLVYLGMAVMLALNVFGWTLTPAWNLIRWFFAVVFAAYGLYRGYRELNGEHTYGMRRYDDDERYTTYKDYDKTNKNE